MDETGETRDRSTRCRVALSRPAAEKSLTSSPRLSGSARSKRWLSPAAKSTLPRRSASRIGKIPSLRLKLGPRPVYGPLGLTGGGLKLQPADDAHAGAPLAAAMPAGITPARASAAAAAAFFLSFVAGAVAVPPATGPAASLQELPFNSVSDPAVTLCDTVPDFSI